MSPDYAITPMAIPTLMAIYPAGMGFAALFALFALVGTNLAGAARADALASRAEERPWHQLIESLRLHHTA